MPDSKKETSADWFMRGALSRIGETIDRLTGRSWAPSSVLATSEIIQRLKVLLDSEAMEVPGKGTVVPHTIRMKVQWDKFSADSDDALQLLERELVVAVVDHINDRLYYTLAPIDLKVTPDYFTEGIKLLAGFDNLDQSAGEKEVNITLLEIPTPALESRTEMQSMPVIHADINLNGRIEHRILEVPSGGRISVGRSGGSHLVIDDPSISKIHASLSVDGQDKISVADTGSTNGTFINGERMAYGQALELSAADIVRFGSVEVTFEVDSRKPDADKELLGRPSTDNTVAIEEFEFTSRSSANVDLPSSDDQGEGDGRVNESGKN